MLTISGEQPLKSLSVKALENSGWKINSAGLSRNEKVGLSE